MDTLLADLKIVSRKQFAVLHKVLQTLEESLKSMRRMYKGKTQFESYVFGSAAVQGFEMIARTCTGLLQHRLEFPLKISNREYKRTVAQVQQLEVSAWYFAFLCNKFINNVLLAVMCLEYAAQPMGRQYQRMPEYVYFLANYLEILCETPIHYRRVEKTRIELQNAIERTQELGVAYRKIPPENVAAITQLMELSKEKYIPLREEHKRQKRLAESVRALEMQNDPPLRRYNPFKLGKRSYEHLIGPE